MILESLGGQGKQTARFVQLEVRFGGGMAFRKPLADGANRNSHAHEDKRIRYIKDWPDPEIDEVHNSTSSQHVQEIAGGATNCDTEAELSSMSLQEGCVQDQENRPDDSDGPEQYKRPPTADEAEGDRPIASKPKPGS